jgi:hypothetical protein
MKIAIVVPDDKQLTTAGVRIRYNRLRPCLQAAGHSFEIVSIDECCARSKRNFDTYIFCKCHDARSLVLAESLALNGAKVGADFFDDYYSQIYDGRFVHLREWLRRIASSLTFVICSTAPMQTTLANVLPHTPCHIINDPIGRLDPDQISRTAEVNVEFALSSRTLRVGWFGMGDNPNFELGLSDVFSFSDVLTRTRRFGFEPHLSILTNRRSLTPERLAMLSRLAVPCHIEEWTEALEQDLIASSTLCFLPVNAQPFSTAKSLNRAITSLIGGAQALSCGYPLYAGLEPFVYRDIGKLLADLESRVPALRRDTVPALLQILDRLGNPETEAAKFVAFLGTLAASERLQNAMDNAVPIVIHGTEVSVKVHKFAARLGSLSVASPFSTSKLNYDVRIVVPSASETPIAILSDKACKLLPSAFKVYLQPHHQSQNDKAYYELRLPAKAKLHATNLPTSDGHQYKSATLATYASTMQAVLEILRCVFGTVSAHLSEPKSPYWMDSAVAPYAAGDASQSKKAPLT